MATQQALTIHLWACPRSLSTSLMYSFAQRSDTTVVDEPLYAHYLRVTGASRPYRDEVLASHDADGERVMDALSALPTAERRLVFAKHMGKQAVLLQPHTLAQGRSLLLLRSPEALVRSFSAVLPASLDETCLPSLLTLFSTLRAAGRAPPVFLAEDLASHPEETLRNVCAALSIPFQPAMLSWPAGPRPEDGVWASRWYAATHASTRFGPFVAGSRDDAPPLSPALSALAEEAAPFYAALAKHAVRPASLLASAIERPMGDAAAAGDGEAAVASRGSGGDAMAGVHGGASHAFVADARNATVLVGIRDYSPAAAPPSESGAARCAAPFRLVPRAGATVSVLDGGFVLGDGVWEGLRVVNGVVVFARSHLQRLWEGLASLSLDPGCTRSELLAMIYAVVDANRMTDGVHIRLMVTRGLKLTPYQDPRCGIGGATIVVLAEHKAPPAGVEPPPLKLGTSPIRRSRPDAQDPALNSHSKHNCIAACIDAAAAGFDEALMLDPDGFVATCNSTNFFIIRCGGTELWTAPAKHLMPGVTRAAVLAAARSLVPSTFASVREVEFSLSSVYGADAAFVTGTFAGLLRVASVDGRPIGGAAARDADAGEAAFCALKAAYKDAVAADVALGRVVRV